METPILKKELGTKLIYKKFKNVGLYECECGKEFEAVISEINRGRKISCGCYFHGQHVGGRRELSYSAPKRLKSIYRDIKNRCYREKTLNYHNYGGRGIKMNSVWANNFLVFYYWALNNGYSEKPQIDRENNDGNYEPWNCRWVTKNKTQHPLNVIQ